MRTFLIGGRWSYARPEYDLWEILPAPESIFPLTGEEYDNLWRQIKLPRENMLLSEIIKFIYERNPELTKHKLLETTHTNDLERVYHFWGPGEDV